MLYCCNVALHCIALFCSRLRRAEEAWWTMEEPWALEAWDLESSGDEDCGEEEDKMVEERGK